MATNIRKAEHLTVDPEIVIQCDKPTMTQKYALVSFVSPDDRIKQRFMYEANRFLFHDVNKQIMDTTTNLVKMVNANFAKILDNKIESYKSAKDPVYKAAVEILEKTKQDFLLNEDEQVANTLRTYKIDQEELTDRFDAYKTLNNADLEKEFNLQFGKEPSVRGFKFRGAFENIDEARKRVSYLHKEVESFAHTFIVPPGHWVPWDPNADAVQDQEYMVPELNTLVGERKKNSEQKDEFFAKRKQMMMESTDQTQRKILEDKLKQRIKEQQEQRKSKK
jgi:hypothetical protein